MYEIVRTENLWKVYPDGTKALKGINLSIMRGEFVGVMGPSGSGKSTLLHLIGGLDKPTEGKVLLFGKDIVSMGEDDHSLFRRG
ncbi:MAG TPA: ATP-binding cassette domain-containing protein, partial [Aquificaceae bacterium]|nr:ATP-binding cassette domain-containing protein [Aquificaceae bacterium]